RRSQSSQGCGGRSGPRRRARSLTIGFMHMNYNFSFPYIWGAAPDLLSGLWMTILVSLISIAFSVIIGTVCASVRVFRIPVLSQLATAYVHFIRSTPLLVQLFFIFYGLASLGLGL